MLYIFDKDDNFKNIITEDTGLIDTWFKDYQNHLIDEPFVFHVDSESELLPLIVAENQVAFKHTFNALQQDIEMLKLMRIKEIDEIYNNDGYIVEVTCEPSWLELYDHFIEDRRINNGTAQTAMNRALQGSRWVGQVAGEFGNGSTNFYWIDAVEALFKIAEEWGGTLQDYITLDENNEIATRIMYLLPRLGRDNGLLIQPGYNAETIERRTLSYPVTAIWGQGASLEIEDDEGQHTGGYTRYITFEDVEWKKSKGDPVDKPKGQKWVGDPDALAKYGYLKDDGTRMHRFGHFSNQDYETPEELLYATWEALQKEKEPEVYHEAVIDEVDKPIFLGDTGTILDRHYGKPIEVQSQITGLEYDILRPMENVKTVLGNYKDMSRDPLEDEIDEIKQNQKRPVIVDKGNFPNKKPMKPTNVEAVGGWETIQLTWTYTDEIYVSHYEVYASQNKDFVPDSQFLVYNGKVSAFGHEVKTDEVWYYRVCAVNYHGVKSEFSDEATASTIRIPLDATNFESIVTDAKNRADEAFDNANIATQNAVEAIGIAQQGFDKSLEAIDGLTTLTEFVDDNTGAIATIKGDVQGLQTSVSKKVDESTFSTFVQQTNNSLAGKISMTDAEGVFVKGTEFSATIDGLQTTVSNKADKSTVTQLAGVVDTKISTVDANNKFATQSQLTQTASSLTSTITSVKNDLDGLEIGGRNLISISNLEQGTFSVSTGEPVGSASTRVRSKNYITIDSRYVTVSAQNMDIYFWIWGYDDEGNLIRSYGSYEIYADGITVEIDEEITQIKFVFRFDDNSDIIPRDILDGRVKAEKGNKATDWSPAPEDMATQSELGEWGLFTISQISQLDSAINLRVKKGDVMSQINIEADRVLISTDGKLVLDAETTLISNAVIKNAHIESLSGEKLISKSVIADKLDVTNLSSITANLGTVRSGRLLSQNNNMDLNLNEGTLVMRNANFTLGGGANIIFTNASNKMQYELNTIRSGIAFTTAIGGQFPLVAMGVTGRNQPLNITDEARFSGFIANARARWDSDGILNSVVGLRFDVRDETVSFSKAFRFMLDGNNPYMAPTNAGAYNYDLGTSNNYFRRLYASSVFANESNVTLASSHNTGRGFRAMVEYQGESQMAFFGLNAHNYFYNLGKSNRRFSYVYLRYQPDVSSDERLKENIENNELGLDFINDLDTKSFNLKDEQEKRTQLGFIAQDVKSTLTKHGAGHLSIVKDESEYLSMEYTQLIAPTIKAIQELDNKIVLTREELVLKIAKLEQRINELECAV